MALYDKSINNMEYLLLVILVIKYIVKADKRRDIFIGEGKEP